MKNEEVSFEKRRSDDSYDINRWENLFLLDDLEENFSQKESLSIEVDPVKERSPSRQQQQVTRLPGRNRFVNISMIPQLRILKRDIRRRFGEMYLNVMNVHDHSLLQGFLKEFCIPSCRFQVNLPSPHAVPASTGILAIFSTMIKNQMSMPDGIQRLGDNKIIVSLEKPGTRIISPFSFRGTVLYDIINEENAVLTPPTEHSKDPTVCLNPSSSSHPEWPRLNYLEFKPKTHPYELHLQGMITMVLDDIHRIEAFHFDIFSPKSH